MITETSPILNLLFAKGLGTKTLSQLVERFAREDVSIDAFVGLAPEELVEHFGLRRNVAESIQACHEQAERVARELEQNGVQILIRGGEPYPARIVDVLGMEAPPVLFAKGNLSIVDRKAVGFCGSRRVSEKGIRVAGDSARLLTAESVNVVSGYAKGVDLTAHCAALGAGGVTAIVLAEGILHFRAKREIRDLLTEENHLIVSEFSPRLPWSGRNAMQRNKTIIGLSDAMIVIESGTSGGTFACAESTMRLGRPLFVADYAVPAESAEGNRYFLEKGATALRGDRQHRPNLQKVFQVLGISGEQEAKGDTEPDRPLAKERHEPCASNTNDDENLPLTAAEEETQGNRIQYPKRLIEVDLPIARISAHARREKSIRHGHISTLHIWWARRPLAACRAVICAALWPDPADPLCPQVFRDKAAELITAFAKKAATTKKLMETCSQESLARWEAIANSGIPLDPTDEAHQNVLRFALLDFIADFANWDNSTVPDYLQTSRALTRAAHKALGAKLGPVPMVIDPFAGGGAIPLECVRIGADVFASDLNPLPVLLNKVVLEFIPRYQHKLSEELAKWGDVTRKRLIESVGEFYEAVKDEETVAFIWGRTILSEAPGESKVAVEVPMLRSLWLSKKRGDKKALRWVRDSDDAVKVKMLEKTSADGKVVKVRQPLLEVFQPKKDTDVEDGTVARGSVTCPVTGFTTDVGRVRDQLKSRRGGADDARLCCVVTTRRGAMGRCYRIPTDKDVQRVEQSRRALESRFTESEDGSRFVPTETLPLMSGVFNAPIYGHNTWRSLFAPRQLLAMATLSQIIHGLKDEIAQQGDASLGLAVQTLLAFALDKQADLGNALCAWEPIAQCPRHLFGRQAIGMVWDFAEGNPTGSSSGCFQVLVDGLVRSLDRLICEWREGHVVQGDATQHPLPNDAAVCLFTDPPYYNAIPYADLSDFFYVWLRRTIGESYPDLFVHELAPKDGEICEMAGWDPVRYKQKDGAWYEKKMTEAMAEARRVLAPNGIGVIVFAHKSTAGWEAQLQAIIDAGWTINSSWPIDTENASRLRAQGSAALGSSIHLVCRPRENPDGSLRTETGEWRDILAELPGRIHEWMPRLAQEGVVGADSIFACLGPALEIFSRCSRVEKASGEEASLREYLEHVWAAVSTEALSMIFKDADAAGLEPDARLTAMWLWTLGAGSGTTNGNGNGPHPDPLPEGEGEEDEAPKTTQSTGYTLEFDAARKIAQGLGIHLEKSESFVEVKGDKARLLPVVERTQYLFGKDSTAPATKRRKKKSKQMSLFAELDEAEAAEGGATGELDGPSPGSTALDRVHQAMILFGAGRGEAMKRFLVEDAVGTDARFWKLAQSLSALYPRGTDEKRWVDGVLARKKGLGL